MSQWRTELIETARDYAVDLQHPYIRSEHLYLALMKQHKIVESVNLDELITALKNLPTPSCGAEQKLTLARGAQRIMAQTDGDISPTELARQLVQSSPVLRRVLADVERLHDASST